VLRSPMNGTGDAADLPRKRELAMERSKAPFGLIGKKLRAELDDANTQSLPERWIDLIRRLKEQECQKSDASLAEASRQSDQK